MPWLHPSILWPERRVSVGTQPCAGVSPHGSPDHLIGEEERRRWNVETERLGGLEIDHQLKLGRLDHWQVGWFGALENFADVDAGLAIPIRKVASVTDQTAGVGVFALIIDRGQLVAGCQR